MVSNLLETGTPFDYKGIDFSKQKDRNQISDQPVLEVGERDIPDRDFIFMDKGADDDPTFEDE
jgi:hypothetical protein